MAQQSTKTVEPSSATSDNGWRDQLPWYAIAPALLMLGLGLRGIAAVGFWVDEFYTLNSVKGGLGESLGEVPYLPYYTIVWAASGGGTCLSETCLRYPSVIAMSLAVLVVAVTARVVSNRWGGLAAGLLMVLAPGVQRYAQDARPYAFGVLLVSLATLALIIGLRSTGKGPWVGYTAAVIAVGLILPVGLAVLAAHAVLMYGRPLWRPPVKCWLISLTACAPVFLLGVWALTNYSFLKERVGDVMVVHPQNVIQGATWLTSGGSVDHALFGAFAAAVLMIALWSREGVRWLIAAGAAVFLIWLVSVGPMLWWQGRSILPLVGLMAVGAGVTLAEASRTRFVAALVLLGLLTLPFYTWNRLPWSRGFDYRQAAQILDADWQAGDRIETGNLLPWVVQWSLEHYTPDGARFIDDTVPPNGRTWRLNSQEPCTVQGEWDLGIGNTVRLCQP